MNKDRQSETTNGKAGYIHARNTRFRATSKICSWHVRISVNRDENPSQNILTGSHTARHTAYRGKHDRHAHRASVPA